MLQVIMVEEELPNEDEDVTAAADVMGEAFFGIAHDEVVIRVLCLLPPLLLPFWPPPLTPPVQ